MRGVQAAHFGLCGRNPREQIFRGGNGFLPLGGGPALLQDFDFAVDGANLPADLFLLRDAVMDAIEIEGDHRVAAGAQFDGKRIKQPQSRT